MLFWPLFGNFWCPVVTLVTFSSNLSNFERNTQKPKKNNQNDFFKKIRWYTFFLLYLWAIYELIWLDITAQTVTLGAKIFKNIKSNPRNPKCAQFFGLN